MFVWFSSSLAILHSPNLFSLVSWPPGLEEGRGRNTQMLDQSLTLGLLVRLSLPEMQCISGFAPCGFYQPLTHLKHLPWLSSITCLPWRSLSSHPLGTAFLLGFAFCFIHVLLSTFFILSSHLECQLREGRPSAIWFVYYLWPSIQESPICISIGAQEVFVRTFLVVWWLRLCSECRGPRFNPWSGT